MPNDIAIWKGPEGHVVPQSARSAKQILAHAQQLTPRDAQHIVKAFQSGSYEMVSGYVLKKSLAALKKQLAELGMEFIGEMLGRPDITEKSVPSAAITDFEAINLARELGVMNSTDAKRMMQTLEMLSHFEELAPEEAQEVEMSKEEAIICLRTCVQSVLGRADSAVSLQFVSFRSALESKTFKKDDIEVVKLIDSPYFFQRTTLSVLLAGVKTKTGAQFEHLVGNTAVIIPVLWPSLKGPERWSVGQSYAEVVSAGMAAAAKGLKTALLAVKGFDYVPESLRSSTFTAAANAVLAAHAGFQNFYNEPAAISALARLGTTIPWPAFPNCMSAVMAVALGNMYGVAFAAQSDAHALLDRLSDNQWDYYLNECLPRDRLIVQKLEADNPRQRWIEIASKYNLQDRNIKDQNVKKLLKATVEKKPSSIKAFAESILKAIETPK